MDVFFLGPDMFFFEQVGWPTIFGRQAFRQLARKVHPDKLPPGSSEEVQLEAKQRFQQAGTGILKKTTRTC